MIKTEPASTQIVRRSVRVDGRQLSYLTAPLPGSDGTVLLIHGSGMSARYWTEQVRGLAPARQVVALDLPGHGESDPIPEASVEAYADAAADFLTALRARSVFVAGHSLGGAVGLVLAARRPQVVEGLVLLSCCAKLPEPPAWIRSLFAFLPAPVRRSLFFTMARSLLYAPGASDHAISMGMQELAACRVETMRRDLEAADAMDLAQWARGLDVPALIMCGSRDAVTPPELSQRLHELIPGSRLRIIEGSGHMLVLEAPERVNQEIRDFIGPGERRGSGGVRTSPAWGPLRRLLGGLRKVFGSR
jgi:pimeloyl-ACP methyl ester carboxylesterase